MMMIAELNSRCRSWSRSRICACTVTSSAVVGSSAISSAGVVDQAHRDHRALPHAAGELVRVVVHAPVRLRDARPGRASRWPAPGGLLGDVRGGPGRPRRSGCPPCSRGAAPTAGPGRSSRRRWPRSSPQLVLVADVEQVGAVEHDLAADLGAACRGAGRGSPSSTPTCPSRTRPRCPRVWPRSTRVAEAVDGLDDAVGGREVDLEVLDGEEAVRHDSSPQPTRTRGSMTAYSRSTMMLATITNDASSSTMPTIERQVVALDGAVRQACRGRCS